MKDPRDIIIQVTASGICGSDLHLYDGLMPSMEEGDIIGHEPMGIVIPLEEAPAAYEHFRAKTDNCVNGMPGLHLAPESIRRVQRLPASH